MCVAAVPRPGPAGLVFCSGFLEYGFFGRSKVVFERCGIGYANWKRRGGIWQTSNRETFRISPHLFLVLVSAISSCCLVDNPIKKMNASPANQRFHRKIALAGSCIGFPGSPDRYVYPQIQRNNRAWNTLYHPATPGNTQIKGKSCLRGLRPLPPPMPNLFRAVFRR